MFRVSTNLSGLEMTTNVGGYLSKSEIRMLQNPDRPHFILDSDFVPPDFKNSNFDVSPMLSGVTSKHIVDIDMYISNLFSELVCHHQKTLTTKMYSTLSPI